jgi:hypothetical protein
LKGGERIAEMEAQVQSESVIVFLREFLPLRPFHFVIDILYALYTKIQIEPPQHTVGTEYKNPSRRPL